MNIDSKKTINYANLTTSQKLFNADSSTLHESWIDFKTSLRVTTSVFNSIIESRV